MMYATQETAIKWQSKLKNFCSHLLVQKVRTTVPLLGSAFSRCNFPPSLCCSTSVVFIRRFFTSAGLNELCDAMLSLRLLNAIARVITSLVYASSHTRRDEIAALGRRRVIEARDVKRYSRAVFTHK